ncbi:MAG: hypothetical protein ACOYXA_15700 [Bacteroidota bacterium]
MKLFAFTLLMAGLLRCETTEVITCFPTDCNQLATVVDLTGLDGCGSVLELVDGTRLEPERRTYIQPPKPEEDPLYHFELKVGDKVKISYRESDMGSVCMAGKVVFITCIQSVQQNIRE